MRKLLSGRSTEEDMEKADRKSANNTPRWVKVSGIIAIILVLLAVIIMILSGGNHGPGRHFKSDNDSGLTPTIEHRMKQL